jgi:hypothetical protein
MDNGSRQYHTRSNVSSQELTSMLKEERKPRSATLLAQIGEAELTAEKKIEEKLKIGQPDEQLEIHGLKQAADVKPESCQHNEMLILLQQVLQKQDILLGENQKLKNDLIRQQTIIDNLSIAMQTLQVTDAARREAIDYHSLLSTTNRQHPSQPLNTFALQAAKQLQTKRITKLLETSPFTGSTEEDAEEWFAKLERKYQDVQLDYDQRSSITRELLAGSAKLCNDTYGKRIEDWQTFKAKIIAHCSLILGNDQFKLGQQLYSRQQKVHEDAMTYFHSVSRLCFKVNRNMDEMTRIKHLTKGVRADARIYMELKNPATAEDLLQSLIKFERLLEEKGMNKMRKMQTNFWLNKSSIQGTRITYGIRKYKQQAREHLLQK